MQIACSQQAYSLHQPITCANSDLNVNFNFTPSRDPTLIQLLGRLDVESEGLLLVTNDGKMCQAGVLTIVVKLVPNLP